MPVCIRGELRVWRVRDFMRVIECIARGLSELYGYSPHNLPLNCTMIRPSTTAQYSTVQYSTTQHSRAQQSTAQHSTAQHSTAQHSTAQHSTAQHSTAHHRTPHHIAPNDLIQQDELRGVRIQRCFYRCRMCVWLLRLSACMALPA
jgi:hypothetical protein